MSFTPNINVITNDTYNIYVEDISVYLPEDKLEGKHLFKYSDTISVDILRHNKLRGAVYSEVTFSTHLNNSPVSIPINMDGWFSILHIVLPSEQWFNKQLNKGEGSEMGLYDVVYYSDGIRIYKYLPKVSDTPVEVPLKEIINLDLNARDYTVYYTKKDYVSVCFLQKCYINLCQQIFNERGFSPCWNKNAIDSELVYKRDLVWMALNVIKYLTELNLLSEVERIIELITSCNGLCSNNLTNNLYGSKCNCVK